MFSQTDNHLFVSTMIGLKAQRATKCLRYAASSNL